MRRVLLLFASVLAYAQPPADPLTQAYSLLQSKHYEHAIQRFLEAVAADPNRTSIRKDLAYTYLKVGEVEEAREQFAAVTRLDPADHHAALEYAFLCHDTRMEAEARRVFDRVRKTGDPASRVTAEQAFQNIDAPLALEIERWKKALELAPESFTAHHELATLAVRRDELELAAQHYRWAWEILPSRKQSLLDLGRVWKALGREEDAMAALLAASRSGEPRARDMALELMPDRYPYVPEFRRAMELDPANVDLHRELAYLLLAMERQLDAEREFRAILDRNPDDLLSNAQLGFLYLVRDERARAMPLLEKVLKGNDISLANRVRAALKMPLLDSAGAAVSGDVKVMAERSLKAGYLRDALQYLHQANTSDPADGWVMLQLGRTYNLLQADKIAVQWFRRASESPDRAIAVEAFRSYQNLRPSVSPIRTSVWMFPVYSSRWDDAFGYGQIKTELKLGSLLHPYVSVRFFGDARRRTTGPQPQFLSESSGIFAVGISTRYWRGLMAWAEAGSAVTYLERRQGVGRAIPDYRGGVSFSRTYGHPLSGESPGWFAEANLDGLYVSRFGDDLIGYIQTRAGWTPPPARGFETQFFWNQNLVRDTRSQVWANFQETGPGMRFRWQAMPRSMHFLVTALRGAYSMSNTPFPKNYTDVRAGFWYAFTR